jgi:hypothetical protein
MHQPRKQQQYSLTIIEKLYEMCSWAQKTGGTTYVNQEPRMLQWPV